MNNDYPEPPPREDCDDDSELLFWGSWTLAAAVPVMLALGVVAHANNLAPLWRGVLAITVFLLLMGFFITANLHHPQNRP